MKPTVHLIYVQGDSISAPPCITNNLTKFLGREFEVHTYDWDEKGVIHPAQGDILIGHLHPSPGTILRNSWDSPFWGRKILLSPFSHAMPEYNAFLDPFVNDCDCYCAICGRYWMDTIDDTPFSHWKGKIKRIDMAVDMRAFPHIKTAFNPPGKRRFLYIGRPGENKGTDYLESLAQLNPDLQFGWMGFALKTQSLIKRHGYVNLSTHKGRRLVANYDFLICCGRSDANPTTILETAAFGLIPVCTPQSGYVDEDWIINIPLDEANAASAILKELQMMPEDRLMTLQKKAKKRLADHFNWERFGADVASAIQTPPEFDGENRQWKATAERNRERLASFSEPPVASPPSITLVQHVKHWIKTLLRDFTKK